MMLDRLQKWLLLTLVAVINTEGYTQTLEQKNLMGSQAKNGDVVNTRPIIGILSVPIEAEGCTTFDEVAGRTTSSVSVRDLKAQGATSCFNAYYVKWVESAGGRAVPIPFDASKETLQTLMSSLNGVLFTGGEVDLIDPSSQYVETASYLLNETININKQGTPFPLWGTCMGMQLLSILIAKDPTVLLSSVYDAESLMLPLSLTADAELSALFSTLPDNAIAWLSKENITTNLHHDGVEPDAFVQSSELQSFYNVLSTNVDRKGKPFVSTIEGKHMPVWGVQWHPERPQFAWGVSGEKTDPISHSEHAVYIGQYLANFFVGQSRQNRQGFPSAQEEEAALIYNYVPHGASYSQYYFF